MNAQKTEPSSPTIKEQVIAEETRLQILTVTHGAIVEGLARIGVFIPEKESYRVARESLDAVRRYAHRGSLHIPNLFKIERNAAIKAEFNGTNLREICDKWDVARSTVYRICGRPGKNRAD